MWGTKEYFAPELIDQAYGPQADLWALGCILFEMLCGHQGEGGRERDRQRGRQTGRERERQTGRQTGRERERQRGREGGCDKLTLIFVPSPRYSIWISLLSLSPHSAFPIRERDNEDTFYGRIQKGEYDFSRYRQLGKQLHIDLILSHLTSILMRQKPSRCSWLILFHDAIILHGAVLLIPLSAHLTA